MPKGIFSGKIEIFSKNALLFPQNAIYWAPKSEVKNDRATGHGWLKISELTFLLT
jgi:hypothetical protein